MITNLLAPGEQLLGANPVLTRHLGDDRPERLVHKAGVTTGKVHDAKVMDRLIREDDPAVCGDQGYEVCRPFVVAPGTAKLR